MGPEANGPEAVQCIKIIEFNMEYELGGWKGGEESRREGERRQRHDKGGVRRRSRGRKISQVSILNDFYFRSLSRTYAMVKRGDEKGKRAWKVGMACRWCVPGTINVSRRYDQMSFVFIAMAVETP